jgi:hypothetical protein
MTHMFRGTILACALLASLALALIPGGTGAASAKSKKPEPCKLFTHAQIVKAVSPDADLVSLQRAPSSAIYGSLIPNGTNCGYLWNSSNTGAQPGNPAGACGYEALGSGSNYSPGYGWIVSYGFSGKQWKRLKHSQATSPQAPDPNGLNGQVEHKINLGHKSQAFYVEDKAYCDPTNPDLFAYTLYVRTRHHNLMAIFLWPSKLGNLTVLAASKLGRRF